MPIRKIPKHLRSMLSQAQLIQPQRRLALLVDQYDEGPKTDNYHRLNPDFRGNASVYQMEAALSRGALDIKDDVCCVLANNAGMSREEAERRFEKVRPIVEEATAKPTTGEGMAVVNQGKYADEIDGELARLVFRLYDKTRPPYYRTPVSVSYEQIRTAFPDAKDVKEEVYGVLSFYAEIADKDTLTVLFFRAHGVPDEVGIFPYVELLDRMDRIAGKKAVVVLACYSGALIDHIQRRETAGDYLVMSSTTNFEESKTWNEDTMLDLVTNRLIREGKPLSKFGSSRVFKYQKGAEQTALLYAPFDVIL